MRGLAPALPTQPLCPPKTGASLAAAKAGSVSRAARALAISQSSVTEAIRALKDDPGIPLFDRPPRGLESTPKGSAYLRHARQILADVATARADTTMMAVDAANPTCAYKRSNPTPSSNLRSDLSVWFGGNPVVPEGCTANGMDNLDKIRSPRRQLHPRRSRLPALLPLAL